MAVALFLVWPAAVAAGEAAVFVGSAALVALGITVAAREVEERTAQREADRTGTTTVQDCPERACPPCNPPPPAGTIRVKRVDRPPSEPHFPCTADHAHLVIRNQVPRTCKCFWNNAVPDVECLPPGGAPSYPML